MRIMLSMTPFILTAAALAAPTSTPATASARIAFATSGGIADWYARDDEGLYLLDRAGNWYFAKLSGACPRLSSLSDIGFDVGPGGDFDAFSSVIVDGLKCRVDTLTRAQRPAEVGSRGKAR